MHLSEYLLKVWSSRQSTAMNERPLNVHQLVINNPDNVFITVNISNRKYVLQLGVKVYTGCTEVIHSTFEIVYQ